MGTKENENAGPQSLEETKKVKMPAKYQMAVPGGDE